MKRSDVENDRNDARKFRGDEAFDGTLAEWTGAGYGLTD